MLRMQLDIPKMPMLIHGDAEKMARLLDNLFSNASKYTSPQGKIGVTLHKREGNVELILSNTCPELSEQELLHLFDRFYHVEKSRSLRTGGAGLGLAIARRIVELHQGGKRGIHNTRNALYLLQDILDNGGFACESGGTYLWSHLDDSAS